MKLLLLKNIVSQTKNRFRNLSLKSGALTMTLVVAGMLLSGNAFGAIYRTSTVVSGGQNRTATYGAATTVTYTITINATRFSTTGTTLSNTLTFAWTGVTPTGVTATLSNGGVYTPGQNSQTVTLTITTSANTDANTPGGYAFTVTSNERNGGAPHGDNDALVIGKKNLTITGVSASDKTYDGTATATVSGGTLNGKVNGDVVSVSTVGAFPSSAVGTNRNVTISLTGADAANYTFTQPTVRADINAFALTVSNLTANNKVYDGSTAATFAAGYTLNGVFTVDAGNVTINPAGVFQNNGPGNNITVTASLSGSASGNYTLTQPTGLKASIFAATYDWTGAQNTTWANAQNWTVAGVGVPATYPGQGNNDDARIGAAAGTITNMPTITANLPNGLNSLLFSNASGPTTLTVNTGLTFNPGDFTVSPNTTTTIVDNGTVTINGNYSNNTGATLNISGSKSFSVSGAFTILTNAGTLNQSGTGSVSFSNTAIGSIVNSGTINQSGTGAFTMNITAFLGTVTNSGTINQTGNATFSATVASFGGNFANSGTITQSSASGTMTFNTPYSNSNTNSKLTQTGTGTLAFNSTFTNKGTTAFGPGTVTIGDDFTNTSGSTAFGAGSASVAGDFSNTGTVTSSTGPVSFASMNFTNNATLTFGTGLVTFNNTQNVTKFNTTTNITFVNVRFAGGKNVLLQSGNCFLASTGVLTLSNGSFINLTPPTSTLTLLSDINGSATIAAITGGSSITGNVSVQRFIKGSSDIGDLSKRGYRLLSSTVYTSTDAQAGGAHVSDLQYLTTYTHVSGAGETLNGFNVTTTANPSIYLFREDDLPPPSNSTIFTTGYNWKGVAQINSTPNNWEIGTQYRNDQANLLDTLTSIPVGNAILFLFRGDISQAVLPISPPMDVTLTHTGTLNTGTIPVRLWFSNTGNNLGNNFSWTDPTTHTGYSTSTSTLTAGFTLVGNPYPSTINWEKYANSNATGALTGSVLPTIWMFNPTNKQYEPYIPLANDPDITTEFTSTYAGLGGGTATGAASNFIASGQGFFVKATAKNQNLTFTENAKISAQPTASNVNELMGKPVQLAAAPRSLLRLRMALDSVNTDDIAILLDRKASTKLVDGEDAEDLGGNGSVVSLSSFSSDSVALAINAMPFPGVKPIIIPLMTSAATSGSYTLTASQLKNLPALYQMWLKDAFTADSVQLKANTKYTFTIDNSNAATFGRNRFTVVIRQDTAFAYKLLDFTASKTDHQSDVQLVWKTANEGNYTNFTVERSTDNGKTFTVIGGMAGTGAGNYSLVDKNPDKGRNLYRLKQEDINNAITYSNVVDVKFNDGLAKLHIFPNPATHTVNLAIAEQGYYKGNYNISFVNSSGRVVKEVKSSQADWQGNITYLMPGTYLVRVVNTKTQSLVGENKFVKL